MTSGDVEKICQACQILYELKRLQQVNNNHHNHNDSTTTSTTTTTSTASPAIGRGTGIGRGTATSTGTTKSKSKSNSMTDAEKRALRMTLSTEEQSLLEEMESFIELNPLPPMPKYVILDADFDVYAKHGKVLKFRDDIWNGSISDAFSRAYRTSASTSTSTRTRTNTNTRTNTHTGAPTRSGSVDDSFDDMYLGGGIGFEMEEGGEGATTTFYDHYHHYEEEGGFVNGSTREARQNRVLIYAARKQASKLGVNAGDVVTHFDGKEFFGTASELKEMIHALYLEGGRSFSMMLNADQSTADILKDYALELQKVK